MTTTHEAPYANAEHIAALDAGCLAMIDHLSLDACARCGVAPVMAQSHAIMYRADGVLWASWQASHVVECCGRRVDGASPTIAARQWHGIQKRRRLAAELWAARAERKAVRL